MERSDWLPRAPALTTADLWRQMATDAYGKEVESAATYSYTWLADQVGHMGLGILLSFATILVARLLPGTAGDGLAGQVAGFAIAVAIVCAWEWSTYQSSVEAAGGQFPIQLPLLRDNALIAAFYMALGAAMGWGLHLDWWLGLPLILLLIAVALVMALPWVRQKMIWQKAALPYLNRMANLPPSMPDEAAAALWATVEAAPPAGREGTPRHVVAVGPVGSGRTRLAASIGTEHAFKGRAVRYIPFSVLADCAAARNLGGGQGGPANIGYWPWYHAQVMIVDDIGPALAAAAQPGEPLEHTLERLLGRLLGPIRDPIALRSTVWLVGELGEGANTNLLDLAGALGRFLGAAPLAILLRPPTLPAAGLRPARAPAAAPAA